MEMGTWRTRDGRSCNPGGHIQVAIDHVIHTYTSVSQTNLKDVLDDHKLSDAELTTRDRNRWWWVAIRVQPLILELDPNKIPKREGMQGLQSQVREWVSFDPYLLSEVATIWWM